MHLSKEEVIDHVLGEETWQAAAHLEQCAECRAEEESFRAVLAAVDNLPGPPDGYGEEMLEALRWRLAPRHRTNHFTAVGATAATLAVVCIAALFSWFHMQRGASPAARPQAKSAAPAPVPPVRTPPATTTMKVVTSTAPVHKAAPPPRRQTPEKVHEVAVHLWPGLLRPRADGDAVERELAAGGDEERLGQIALNDESPEVRLEAITALQILQTPEAEEQLVAIYPAQSDLKARRAIIAAVAWQRNAVGLEQLARNETDPALKKNMISLAERIRRSQAPEQLTHNPQP